VSRIRNKLGLMPEYGWRLAAVYRHGYRLERLKKVHQTFASSDPPKLDGLPDAEVPECPH
jgi:hypothetical protein